MSAITRIDLPVTEEKIRALAVGDEIAIYGTIVTGRDGAHKLMHEAIDAEKAGDPSKMAALEWLRPLLKDSFIYHCGPVMKKDGDDRGEAAGQAKWKVVAAGPTTSSREEPYQAEVIERFGLRGVIGKGGMGPKTAGACQKFGAVYMHGVGGAAVAIASAIKEVVTVHLYDELGPPEAFWVLRVEDFRGVVTIDSRGGSLHKDVLERSKAAAAKYFG
jgi:fumarate hydratase subunit beta